MYADLRQFGSLNDPKATEAFEQRKKELNALPQIDYEAVKPGKARIHVADVSAIGQKDLEKKRLFFIREEHVSD